MFDAARDQRIELVVDLSVCSGTRKEWQPEPPANPRAAHGYFADFAPRIDATASK